MGREKATLVWFQRMLLPKRNGSQQAWQGFRQHCQRWTARLHAPPRPHSCHHPSPAPANRSPPRSCCWQIPQRLWWVCRASKARSGGRAFDGLLQIRLPGSQSSIYTTRRRVVPRMRSAAPSCGSPGAARSSKAGRRSLNCARASSRSAVRQLLGAYLQQERLVIRREASIGISPMRWTGLAAAWSVHDLSYLLTRDTPASVAAPDRPRRHAGRASRVRAEDSLAFGDAHRAARIQDIEGVRAFQDVIMSRQHQAVLQAGLGLSFEEVIHLAQVAPHRRSRSNTCCAPARPAG